jgi:hypothetical protein
MINVEPTTAEWVAERFANAPKADLERSVEIWKIKDEGGPVMIVGVIRRDLIGWAEIWVILTEGLEYHWWSSLRQCKRMINMTRGRYAGLIAHAKPGPDERFAKFFGFKEVARTDEYVRFVL